VSSKQPRPADLDAICGENSKAVQLEMIELCSADDIETAFSRFAESCSEDGNEVGT
jgi:hypothetical protein